MTDNTGFNKDFNAAIDDLLPNNANPGSESESSANESNKENHRWRRVQDEWHTLRSVDEYRCDELVDREIENYSKKLGCSTTVCKMAKQLFDQYVATQEFMVIELTTAAAVYSAAKINSASITPSALVEADNGPLDRTMLLRQSKDIANELGLNPEPFFSTDAYVDDFCDELELSDEVNMRAKQILDYCDESGVSSGKSPTGWTAAALYLACSERDCSISQSAVADVADVSEVTVRNRYSEQREVVVDRECPENIEEIVDWTCDRVNLPEDIRTNAKSIIHTDPNLTIKSHHDIPLSFSKDPSGWGMAAVKVAANSHEYNLNYTPLKILSGYDAKNIKRRVQALNNADGIPL